MVDARMRLQPDGQWLAIPAGEDVNRPAPFEVEQDRGIALAPPQGEVIDAQHPRGRHRALTARPQNPQERIGAGRRLGTWRRYSSSISDCGGPKPSSDSLLTARNS
jgi:hypothetical protein